MTYEIPADLLAEIALLPPFIQAFINKYPIQVANVAEYYFEPPLEVGYEYTTIEIFHDDATEPQIIIMGDELDYFEPGEPNPNFPVTAIRVDGHWVFTEIEGHVILDRRGAMVFPVINADSSEAALFKTASFSISSVIDRWQSE